MKNTTSIITVWDAIHTIAFMMADEGYTATEVRAAADTLRHIKSIIWEAERFTSEDHAKLVGTNAWILDHVADEMIRIFGAEGITDEMAEDLAQDMEWTIEELWTNLATIAEKHETFNAEIEYEETSHEDAPEVILWDDDDDEYEDEDEGRTPFDGNASDLGDLLGDFEWQYDIDAVVDMLTITTPHGAFWLRDDEVPDWSEVDDACMWAPITENIEHILEWYNSRADTDIVDVDDEMVLDALTKGEGDHRIWKSLTWSKVEDIIYDLALLTSDNIGCMPADDIHDEWLDEMYEVLAWADVLPMWIEPEDERVTLGRVWFALVDDPYGFPTWKHLTRTQVAEIVDDVLS